MVQRANEPPVTVVCEEEPYRLISDAHGRYAVIEARGGRVYSLDPMNRHEAEDTPDGMACVVGDDGWRDEDRAWRRFNAMLHTEDRYSKIIW